MQKRKEDLEILTLTWIFGDKTDRDKHRITRIASLCKGMPEQRVRGSVRRQSFLRARKLWRVMIAHVLKAHDTYKKKENILKRCSVIYIYWGCLGILFFSNITRCAYFSLCLFPSHLLSVRIYLIVTLYVCVVLSTCVYLFHISKDLEHSVRCYLVIMHKIYFYGLLRDASVSMCDPCDNLCVPLLCFHVCMQHRSVHLPVFAHDGVWNYWSLRKQVALCTVSMF